MLLHAPRPARTRSARLAPDPAGLHDLSELTRSVADAGPHRSPRRRPRPATSAGTGACYADPFVDVWLISWATEQATELHDHAGSLGALTVVSGELDEQRWVPAERGLRTRRLRAGEGATSRSATCTTSSTASREHAVSVHAYSPPLTAMSYYAVDAGGRPAAHPHGAHHGGGVRRA